MELNGRKEKEIKGEEKQESKGVKKTRQERQRKDEIRNKWKLKGTKGEKKNTKR